MSETLTRPTTISPNVRTIRACSPKRRPEGGSAERLAGLALAERLSNAELLHRQGRDAERIHFQSRYLLAKADKGRGMEEGDQGRGAHHPRLHRAVGVHPALRIERPLRVVQERIHRAVGVAEVVRP